MQWTCLRSEHQWWRRWRWRVAAHNLRTCTDSYQCIENCLNILTSELVCKASTLSESAFIIRVLHNKNNERLLCCLISNNAIFSILYTLVSSMYKAVLQNNTFICLLLSNITFSSDRISVNKHSTALTLRNGKEPSFPRLTKRKNFNKN